MARNARLARLRLIPAVSVVSLALVVSGCGSGQLAQTAIQVAAVDGANGTAGPIGVRDVRLAPTEENAYEAGADIPVKLWLSNDAIDPNTLTSVSTPAADSVVVTGDAAIQGQTLREITADGDTTVVVTGLKEELPYGHSIPMTFTFASGGTITVNVPIEIPAERSTEARETVDILPEEHGNIWFGDSEESETGASDEGH